MERPPSTAMFISEIPVRCPQLFSEREKSIHWINNLTAQTTARDIIASILPSSDPNKYSLYIYIGRSKQLLGECARIYKVVASIQQQKSARRLFFEIRSKKVRKRVRFADEIVVQNIVQGQCITDEHFTTDLIETIVSKENDSTKKQPRKSSLSSKRSSLKIIPANISPSSSESGISSHCSDEDGSNQTNLLETLV